MGWHLTNRLMLPSEVTESNQVFDIDDQRVWFCSSERMPFLRDQSVDLALTSPPYWNLKQYGMDGEIGQEDYCTYIERLKAVWSECFRVAKDNAVLIVNVANRRHRKRFYPIAMDIAHGMEGWCLWDIMIWYVPNALPQPNHYRERLFDSKHEYLLILTKGDPAKHTFNKPRVTQKYANIDPRVDKMNAAGRCLGNVIRVPAYRPPNIRQRGYHIAAFPEELAALLIHAFTAPDDTVLDPFLGSGTTLKVARSMGRRGYGVELNPDFRSLIEQRVAEPFVVPQWRTLDLISAGERPASRRSPRRPDVLRLPVGMFDDNLA